MTLILEDPPGPTIEAPAAASAPKSRSVDNRSLTIAAFASLAAGTIHVAATAGHGEHRQAVWTFVGVAVAQLVWGGYALARPRRWVAGVGVLLAAGVGAGWVLAKVNGIPFIDGLDSKEAADFADTVSASLALLALLTAGTAFLARRLQFPKFPSAAVCLAAIAIAVPASVSAVDHSHAGSGSGDHGHTEVATDAGTGAGAGPVETPAAVPPRAFDPDLPIDLGGVPGVSPEQQARAENLLATTLVQLPMWSDPAYAESRGFFSIGDGGGGSEHYLNLEYMDDDVVLDPTRPESLVWDTTVTPKRLVAAMYMLRPGDSFEDAPDIGGALTQWHIHNNLCFNTEGQVRGLTNPDGSCNAPLVQGRLTPMMHVWLVPHPCGPFAALEGIAGGQVPEGEAIACDHAHG